jgi:hypothetical protein
MTTRTRFASERGTALVIVMMVLVLALAMLGGFMSTLVTDQQLRSVDQSRTRVFYATHGALERLTSALGELFISDFAPTADDIQELTEVPPSFDQVSFTASDGSSGYTITPIDTDADGNPVAVQRNIKSGPFQGFIGLTTGYALRVTGRTAAETTNRSEVRLERELNTVAIPVFQFGIFSETDLSFFAGPNFNFGGRVHTNGNLFLASGNGSTLTMADRVTAVREVVRTNLSNGHPTEGSDNPYPGPVRIATAPGAFRNLARAEGSLQGTLGSAQNEPAWTDLSIGAYNGYLRNGRTGARRLDLPFVSLGATPISLIQRGAPADPPQLLSQRYYSLASVRILLSDSAADIAALPGITAEAALPLRNLGTTPIAGYTVDAAHPPLAISIGNAGSGSSQGYRTPAGTPLLGGVIKVEIQLADETWRDVTLEVLNLGLAGRNLTGAAGCAQPSPNAVIRVERIRNDPTGGAGAAASGTPRCGTGSTNATDYWPNVLYDTREALVRDDVPRNNGTLKLGGVMHYVELDVNNLRRWLLGEIGASGSQARSVNGYTVYFSDRRTNRNAANQETGEFGFEDFVNPGNAAGSENGQLDAGEDVNGNGQIDLYGRTAIVVAGSTGTLGSNADPGATVTAEVSRVNRAVLFRRALKVTNGALGQVPMPGLTIASENPVYVQGHFNANAAGFGNGAAAAVVADAVTVLSGNWNDNTSLNYPNDPTRRPATTTWYRFAVLSGKGRSFPRPNQGNPPQDFGTDGGVHNFIRYLEDWSGQALNYRGSIASFYYSRQGVGTYKCCNNVYSPPTRGYNFDTNFLNPLLLPPFTPMFRDINTTGFTQALF